MLTNASLDKVTRCVVSFFKHDDDKYEDVGDDDDKDDDNEDDGDKYEDDEDYVFVGECGGWLRQP